MTAIVASEIKFKYSTKSGAAGHDVPVPLLGNEIDQEA